MSWWFAFAVFLYLVSASLLIAEVFIPSGGIISVCSMACLIGGIAIFFKHSIVTGWIGIVIAIIMIPTIVIIAYKIFPKTKFGKSVSLAPSERQKGDAVPDSQQLQDMVGAVGTVISKMRPVGMCDFDGKRLECVAESGYIDKRKKVEIIHVQATQLTVRLIEK